MKRFQQVLRATIATGCVTGFLGGWVLIAHAGKPATAPAPLPPIVAPAPLPSVVAPAPLPPIIAPSSLQPLPPMRSTLRPRLRTGGS